MRDFTQAEIDAARAEHHNLCDAQVLRVVKQHGGTTVGKIFQTVGTGRHALRDYMDYRDLVPTLRRLEQAAKVIVDRTASKGPSKWVITLRGAP